MKVLIIADEVWNDSIHGNNVLSNWFEGFNAEFAEIYCSPGQPLNKCCKLYFQITDRMMFKSLFFRSRAGAELILDEYPTKNLTTSAEPENKKLYSFLKSIKTESIRVLRELLWLYGKYDENKLRKFIEQFNPDIIFCPRLASLKILRLERIVKQIANKPMVAYTGDNEYSLFLLRLSPLFWVRYLILRRNLRKNMKLYSLYYTHSDEQGNMYSESFKVRSKTIYKCSDFYPNGINKTVNKPIKLVYAGKLYCKRWKSLAHVAKALRKINKDEIKIILDIYTKDKITKHQKKLLDDGRNSSVKGSVSLENLRNIYKNADISLHVESLDIKNRLITKYSFSTKIIDCLASSCAVMAICWNRHAGYIYLSKEEAAICVDSYKMLESTLQRICDEPQLINEYAKRASECGLRRHFREVVQQNIYNDFNEIITMK